ncbi:helix-turn-helix domain-containing protein [Phytohabitans suffuscus]|uniref:Uncharacterized protein n=1 Tax=Phytohabitans suffuscus TaxID=624315 RepID=A0A6F8YIT1_9ACTN|nr:hypothetical protein [Phytohabitans suffuscus]BCB85851.1 hypothetical protein Psuf_031640 [Phytohabitans suffuscus]
MTVAQLSPSGSDDDVQVRPPNTRLRQARLRTPSPADGRFVMSRQELAEAVNAHVFQTTGRVSVMDAHYVARLERGIRRYPNDDYRAAFRAVLGVATDVELGFTQPGRPLEAFVTTVEEQSDGSVTQLVVAPGMAVVIVPADHPALLALVADHQERL